MSRSQAPSRRLAGRRGRLAPDRGIRQMGRGVWGGAAKSATRNNIYLWVPIKRVAHHVSSLRAQESLQQVTELLELHFVAQGYVKQGL